MKGWIDTMKQLLKLEFRRLTRLKSLYICSGIMVALVFLSALTTEMLLSIGDGFLGDYLGSSGINAMLRGFVDSSFELLIAIFVALSVCEDFEQKTIRVILSRGHSRKGVFFTKMLALHIICTVVFVAVLLVSFGAGTLFFGTGNAEAGQLLRVLGVQYATCMAEVMMFFGISYLLRKNGASIAVTIVVPAVIPVILTLLDVTGDTSLSKYWISGFWNDLSYLRVSDDGLLRCLIGAGLYWVGFGALGLLGAEKSEA